MSPAPTDVSYHRSTNVMESSQNVATTAQASGVAKDQHGAAIGGGEGRASCADAGQGAAAVSAEAAGGAGPGNMPSGISVQELKQMTALRMAHAQGHVRVVSPFQPYGER